MKYVNLMILQDGETYTGLDGCSIVTITEDEDKALAEGEIGLGDLEPVSEIILKDWLRPR